MTYASPDMWHTLPPPVQLNEQPARSPELDQIDVPNSILGAHLPSGRSAKVAARAGESIARHPLPKRS
jgi:hypothetical protein